MTKSKIWMNVTFTLVLLAASTTLAFAQSEGEPLEEPVPAEAGTTFWTNPVVRLLADFFSSLFQPSAAEGYPVEGPTITPDFPDRENALTEEPTEGQVEESDPAPDATPTPLPEQVVAMLHTEEDLGFGEMVKLLAIVEEAQAACEYDLSFCDVTIESLLQQYQESDGFGELFDEYGKPQMTGVGHVRQEADGYGDSDNGQEFQNKNQSTLQNQYQYTVQEEAKVKSNNGMAKGKNK